MLFGSKSIKWNVTKFIVGRDRAVRARFAPTGTPEQRYAVIAETL